MPRDNINSVWAGFMKDPATGKWLAKYGDGRELSQTNLKWIHGKPMTDVKECTSITGKIIFMLEINFMSTLI